MSMRVLVVLEFLCVGELYIGLDVMHPFMVFCVTSFMCISVYNDNCKDQHGDAQQWPKLWRFLKLVGSCDVCAQTKNLHHHFRVLSTTTNLDIVMAFNLHGFHYKSFGTF